jgi:hypothetical protein
MSIACKLIGRGAEVLVIPCSNIARAYRDIQKSVAELILDRGHHYYHLRGLGG